MTAPRHILLRQPHMAHLLDHPALDAMDIAVLRALEAFMGFCAAEALEAPDEIDIRAFAQLQAQGPEEIGRLGVALEALGLGEVYAAATQEVERLVRHRADFRGISKLPRRTYERSVSVPPDALPGDWQQTLRRLRVADAYAPSILDRMEGRLGMFAWSADRHGHAVDLADIEALKAFYGDLRHRSAVKNDGEPRWAYLRTAWEELRRFARAHGLCAEVVVRLSTTHEELSRLERSQSAQKFTKLQNAGTASSLLALAEERLMRAEETSAPHLRHARRNAAVAIPIGIIVPARPEDVLAYHVFGQGIYYEPQYGAYRFRYVPTKTRRKIPEELDIQLRPYWNRFIDALILQDHDPRYLGALREQAFAERRPLYVHYDGTRCEYGWYSSAWRRVAQTGGHIARTMIYDEMADLGEFGIQYARGVNHHVSDRISKKYRSQNAIRKSYALGQRAMISRGLDDDISDLL